MAHRFGLPVTEKFKLWILRHPTVGECSVKPGRFKRILQKSSEKGDAFLNLKYK